MLISSADDVRIYGRKSINMIGAAYWILGITLGSTKKRPNDYKKVYESLRDAVVRHKKLKIIGGKQFSGKTRVSTYDLVDWASSKHPEFKKRLPIGLITHNASGEVRAGSKISGEAVMVSSTEKSASPYIRDIGQGNLLKNKIVQQENELNELNELRLKAQKWDALCSKNRENAQKPRPS